MAKARTQKLQAAQARAHAKHMRQKWRDPEYHARMVAMLTDSDLKARRAEAVRAYFAAKRLAAEKAEAAKARRPQRPKHAAAATHAHWRWPRHGRAIPRYASR